MKDLAEELVPGLASVRKIADGYLPVSCHTAGIPVSEPHRGALDSDTLLAIWHGCQHATGTCTCNCPCNCKCNCYGGGIAAPPFYL